jgi:putative Mg2+ transporter-C (MgtC) family protein
MDWIGESYMALQTLLAAFLGAVIGVQRERDGHEAGVRTHAAVALGACLFGLLGGDHRIAAQVVSGIGFIGAGIILRGGQHQHRVKGLTTAATLWATAAIGLTVGYQRFWLGTLGTTLIVGILCLHHLPGWKALTTGAEKPLERPAQPPASREPRERP